MAKPKQLHPDSQKVLTVLERAGIPSEHIVARAASKGLRVISDVPTEIETVPKDVEEQLRQRFGSRFVFCGIISTKDAVPKRQIVVRLLNK